MDEEQELFDNAKYLVHTGLAGGYSANDSSPCTSLRQALSEAGETIRRWRDKDWDSDKVYERQLASWKLKASDFRVLDEVILIHVYPKDSSGGLGEIVSIQRVK